MAIGGIRRLQMERRSYPADCQRRAWRWMKRHVIVKASSLFRILLFSGGIPMRQQLATLCAWSAVSLTLAALPLAPLHAEEASKPPVKVELSREERIEQALDRPCELAFDAKPLEEAVVELEKHYGFAVRLDSKALMEAGVAYETPVTLAKSSSLAGALKQLLEPHELTFVIRHEALMITTCAAAELEFDTRVYPVYDLVVGSENGSTELARYALLAEKISIAIAPDSWSAHGGSATITPFPNAGALVVCNQREAQQQVEQLLSAIRLARVGAAAETKTPVKTEADAKRPSVVRKGYVDPKHRGIEFDQLRARTRSKFEAALRPEGAIYIDEASLDDFVKEIATRCRVPIVFDQKSLMEAGVQPDIPTVRIDLKHLSYRSALEIVLDEQDLTWLIADDAVVITTKASAESEEYTRQAYPVGDLVTGRGLDDQCFSAIDHERLFEVIENTVCPKSWYHVQPGISIELLDDTMVVVYWREIHEGIEQLLASLREVKSRQFPEGKLEPMPEKAGDGLVLRVYEVSAKPKVVGGGSGGGFFNFDDKQPAAAAGTPAEKPKADAAKPPENAKCEAPAAPTVNPDHALAEQLVTAIPELIEPKSWQAGGGPGKIFAVGPRLLVRQTCDVHAQIKDLLKAIGQ